MSDVSVDEAVKERVVRAGEENQKLSDVDGYAHGVFSHEDNLDGVRQLKLLHLAAWTGDVRSIEDLKGSADGTATTAGGFSPLHLAASRGHNDALRLLLEWPNVDVEAPSSEGFTALHLAAYGGHSECVEALLLKCPTYAHVSARDSLMGRTALHWAASLTSSRKIFDLLLQYPEEIMNTSLKDRAGITPLHFAAMNVEEKVLQGKKKALLLREIHGQQPGVLDETHDQSIKEIFQDETKKAILEEIQNLRFAERTPEELIEAILEGIPAQMVKKLLNRFPDQVNDKVGNVGWFLSMPAVKAFDCRPWKELSGITTVHPASRELEGYMSGYTTLHFAARQDNTQLLTHLLTLPMIKVNEREMIHGMTPLHCSLLTGSMKAFAKLMSFEGVDVNAPLVQGWKGTLLTLTGDSTGSSSVTLTGDQRDSSSAPLRKEFHSLETPLHLGVRFCPSKEFLQMITTFVNCTSFKYAICNDKGVFPLQLAWERSALAASGSDNTFASRFRRLCSFVAGCIMMSRFSSSATIMRKNFTRKEEFRELQDALDIFEELSGNGFLMRKINDQKKTADAITKALLVAATLIGAVTFQASVQEPEERGCNELDHIWYYCSNTSFVYAVGTMFYCLDKFLTRHSLKHHRVFADLEVHWAVEHIRGVFLLSLSVLFGVAAYFVSDHSNKRLRGYGKNLVMHLNTYYFTVLSASALYTCLVLAENAYRRYVLSIFLLYL